MTTFNSENSLSQIDSNLVENMTEEQASTATGGFRFLSQLATRAANGSQPTANDIDCLVFDIGGDAVFTFQAPAFLTPYLTRSPHISLMSPQ
jgi:hypothetical protein